MGSFLACLLFLEMFVHIDVNGVTLLVPEDRVGVMGPVFGIYTAYLTGILGFWYTRPFKPARSDARDTFRFALALVFTVVFNAGIVYLIGGRLVLADVGALSTNLETANTWAAWLSAPVAIVNAHYFGTKESA